MLLRAVAHVTNVLYMQSSLWRYLNRENAYISENTTKKIAAVFLYILSKVSYENTIKQKRYGESFYPNYSVAFGLE